MFLTEKYDMFKDLFFNKENDTNDWYSILDDFKNSGGKILGRGKRGIALTHPSWGYVAKVFNSDDPYLKFIRYVYRNPSPFLPKLLDIPRRIVPNFKRVVGGNMSNPYVVRMEELEPISDYEWIDIESYLDIVKDITSIDNYHSDKIESDPQIGKVYNSRLKKRHRLERRHPNLVGIVDVLSAIELKDFGDMDIHKDNIMKRGDQYVITDPVWDDGNASPYADIMRQQHMYADRVDNDYVPKPKELGGGKKYPTKKRPKKVRFRDVYDGSYDDDLPF